MAHHGWVEVESANASIDVPDASRSPFGRLFPASDHSYSSMALAHLAGGRGPIEADPPASPPVPSPKPANPAGFTFLGQFIDHDVTEFRVVDAGNALLPVNPTLGQRQHVLEDPEPTTATNGRSAHLDLDAVYGLRGEVRADQFDPSDGQFLLEGGTDIVRHGRNRLIADPRNDENVLVLQVHLLFERLHNRVHGAKSARAGSGLGVGEPLFDETRRQVQNAYRRIVLHDYLPRIVQQAHLDAVLDHLREGSTFFHRCTERARDTLRERGVDPERAETVLPMPVEFAQAVFRLGHSQLRQGYRLTDTSTAALFAASGDLRGNKPLTPGTTVQWKHFFEGGPTPPQPGEPLDAKLPAATFRLPPPAVGEPPLSLAERNIRRGVDFGLPSGQEAWAYLQADYGPIPTTPEDTLFPAADFSARFVEVLGEAPLLSVATPLWYYVLREAGEHHGGPQLGAVGGLVVAETLLGLLHETPDFDLVAESQQSAPAPGTAATPTSVEEIRTMEQLVKFLGGF